MSNAYFNGAHAADFVRYEGSYVIICPCGYKSTTTVRKQAIMRVERHNGTKFVEASGPEIVQGDPNVARERAPRRVEAALDMRPSQLERANICGKCGEQLRDERGFYGVIFYPDTMLQLPTCIPCKTKYLAGELA